MIQIRILLAVMFFATFISCNQKHIEVHDYILLQEFHEDGTISEETRMTLDSIPIYSVSFSIEKKVHGFRVHQDGENNSGEYLYFHANGKVSEKVSFSNNARNGMGYFFYESGVIKHKRNWVDEKKVGLANDYHDTTGNMKAVLLYNNDGQLYYRKSFDQHGNMISVEGNK